MPMAISALSSSLSISKTISFLSPSTPTSKTHFESPRKSKTHLGFPLPSPSISLYTQINLSDRNRGLAITPIGAINAWIMVDEDEPEESIIRRFNREALRAGVFQECRRRRYFESTQERKKRKAREAMKRRRRRRFQPRPEEEEVPEDLEELLARREAEDDLDDDDGNWEFPEGDLPYQWT